MQESVNLEARVDESIAGQKVISLHDYLSNNNYRNLLVFSLIFMFSILFYLIYLIVDSLIDKSKHYKLSIQCYEKYELARQSKLSTQKSKVPSEQEEDEDAKLKLKETNRKIDFTVWSYRNLQISFIHSVLCSLWLIRILVCRNSELFSDLLINITWDTYLLLAFSCGYFLYDFYDIYVNGYFKKEWVVCLHHWIVLVSFTYHMINLISVGYTVIALLMEFNSVFLHARKLLKFYGYKSNSLVCRLNCFFNISTFVVFRFGVLCTIFYSIRIDGHRVTKKYLTMLLTCTILMAIINIVLFKRLVQKDLLSKKQQQQQQTLTKTLLEDNHQHQSIEQDNQNNLVIRKHN